MGAKPAFLPLQGSSEPVLPLAANAAQLCDPEYRQNPYRVAKKQRLARIAELNEQARVQGQSVKIGLATVVAGALSVFSVSHFLSTPGIAGISLGMAGAALVAASVVRKSMLEQERLVLENLSN